jgi:hypothetical protein
MANSLQTQLITDGPRNATVKITGVLDTSDVSLVTVVNPSSFSPIPTGFRIYHLDYSISDQLELQLLWHATTDQVIMPLAGRGRMSFVDFGGLTNNAGAGVNGAIDILTTGWASGTQVFSLILELVKVGPVGVGRQ